MGAKYDGDYFFIHEVVDERRPRLTPDEDTFELPYMDTALPVGTKPLIFFNSAYERQKSRGITPFDPPPRILFEGADVLVDDMIREKLLKLNVPNLAIQPSIYIDHNGDWHEGYWFLTFTDEFACWDPQGSIALPSDEPDEPAEVIQYSLDDELLDQTPLENRCLFRMGGTTVGMIVVHFTVAPTFQESGAVLVPVTEYGVSFP